MQITPDELLILKQAAEIMLRLQPPALTDKFVVTTGWIHGYKTPAGSWKAKQLRAIGVYWPPKIGWLSRADGQVITQAKRREFESFAKQPMDSDDTDATDTTRKIDSCNCKVLPWEDCIHTLAKIKAQPA